METLSNFETGLEHLKQLVEWADANAQGGKRNEATTRLHLIDELIIGCLGWPRAECKAEDRLDRTYADYALGHPATLLIVEAKREGDYFEVPAGFDRLTCSLPVLLKDNASLGAAVKQAIDYCHGRGVSLGCVTNGHQLVAFLASRSDGVPPMDGRALVFDSLARMVEEFRTAWECLSPPGVATHSLERMLRGEPASSPPEKLSARLVQYPGFKNRNRLQTDLQILGGLFLQDIEKALELEEDFLKECYCPSGALSQYALVSKEILATRYSALFEKDAETSVESARHRDGVSDKIGPDILAASVSSRPIILLGDVGVGKTMFIRHLTKVEGGEIFKKAIVLYVDFGDGPALETELEKFVNDELVSQLRTQYRFDAEEDAQVRAVYHAELNRFDKGIWAPLKEEDPPEFRRRQLEFLASHVERTDEHLKACLSHLVATQQKQVIVFLDNVDQRPFEFQEKVFLIAQSFAAKLPVTVFVSLRPETFYRSRDVGSLSGYQPRVFTISPPRVEKVIEKRLAFASAQLASTGRLDSFPGGLKLESASLETYLKVILLSFRENRDLGEFIDSIAGGNVRLALSLLEAFVGSGHVDTAKILEIAEETGRYIIPLHEFLRAVIYGDHEHYDPASSVLPNVFDISQDDGREHFLLLAVLAYVQRLGDSGRDQGFVAIEAVFSFGQSLGFSPSQVQDSLDRAQEKRLLEARPASQRDSDAVDRLRVTTVGAYVVKRLVLTFTYIDAMIVDTPIVDSGFASALQDERSIRERLERCEQFLNYLDSQWAVLAAHDAVVDWPLVSSSLRKEIARIARRVEGNQRRGGRRSN